MVKTNFEGRLRRLNRLDYIVSISAFIVIGIALVVAAFVGNDLSVGHKKATKISVEGQEVVIGGQKYILVSVETPSPEVEG